MVVAKRISGVIVIALCALLHPFGMAYCFKVPSVSEPPDGRESVAEIKTPAVTIDSIQFANIDKKGRVINDYGEPIEGYRVKYLAQRINYRPMNSDSLITLDVKFFNRQGELMRDAGSPEGCSYQTTIRIENSDDNQWQYLGKLKRKFGKGYRMEIYDGSVCILSIPVPTQDLITHAPIMVRTNTRFNMTKEFRRYLHLSPDRRKVLLSQLYLHNYTGPFLDNYIITGWRAVEK